MYLMILGKYTQFSSNGTGGLYMDVSLSWTKDFSVEKWYHGGSTHSWQMDRMGGSNLKTWI